MKISAGVNWYTFGDKVYVHSVDSQRDYIFDGIAPDVLNFFAEHDDGSFKDLCAKLSAEYDVAEFVLQKDLEDFVDELLAEEILYEGRPYSADSWSNKITAEVSRHFIKEHKLFSLALELTWRCPEKCIHCYIDDAPNFCAADELTLDEYKKILRQARELGCINLLLTGGEVLLRPDLCDIAEYAVKLGFIVNIYTTGLGLTDEIFARLCAAKLNSVSFSLYGAEAREHDKITGVKGSFEKTLLAALMFKAAGVNTFIKSVAMKQNFDSLEGLYELGKRLNLYVAISPRILSGHKGKCAADYALGDFELYKKFYELRARYVPADPTAKNFSREEILDEPACNAGHCSLSIDPFGGVRACLSFPKPFGSVREETLRELWERTRTLDFKNRRRRAVTPKCAACEYSARCNVCVAELILEQGENFCDCGETSIKAAAFSSTHFAKGESS